MNKSKKKKKPYCRAIGPLIYIDIYIYIESVAQSEDI